MIPQSEVRDAAERLGVPEYQIARDHVVSHMLHALETFVDLDHVVFFGGTALCRTWCPNLRLSEDIDLITAGYPATGPEILTHIQKAKQSEFPDFSWGPFGSNNDTQTTIVSTGSSDIKVQFVKPRPNEEIIPVEPTSVLLAYSDLPASTRLTVPTAEGFAAMKLMAWHQRQACRDLYDLAALAEIGALTSSAVELTYNVTKTRLGHPALNHKIPPKVENRWDEQIAHQLGKPRSAQDCLAVVLTALATLERLR